MKRLDEPKWSLGPIATSIRAWLLYKVAQDDHLECEEEFVLPTIRDTFEDSKRTSMIQSLLTDDLVEDKRSVLD